MPDAAQALVALLEHAQGGHINICSGQPVPLGHVAQVLAQACGGDARAVLDLATSRPGDPPLLVGENLRLLATGWRPVWTLEQGLADMVQHARARM